MDWQIVLTIVIPLVSGLFWLRLKYPATYEKIEGKLFILLFACQLATITYLGGLRAGIKAGGAAVKPLTEQAEKALYDRLSEWTIITGGIIVGGLILLILIMMIGYWIEDEKRQAERKTRY